MAVTEGKVPIAVEAVTLGTNAPTISLNECCFFALKAEMGTYIGCRKKGRNVLPCHIRFFRYFENIFTK